MLDRKIDGKNLRCANTGRKIIFGLLLGMNLWKEVRMAGYKNLLLAILLHGSESRICQVQHKRELNTLGICYLGEKVKTEWLMNECGLNTEIKNDQNKRSTLG